MPNRLTIYLSESATAAPQGSGDDLGELYREPFTVPLRMWGFSTRVVEALCSHAWQPTQVTNELWLVLTPALPHGTSRVLDEGATYRRVLVGLAPARWNAAPPSEQRRMLLEIAVRELAPVQERWELEGDALAQAARELLAEPARVTGPVGDAEPVSIGDAFASLELDTWRRTAPAHRLAVGRAVAERVRGTGRSIDEPALVTLAGDEVVVGTQIDGVPFVLVPGGRMQRGFDEVQLALLDKIYKVVWAHASGPGQTSFPRAFTPFGADVECRVDLPERVDIAPMWMAAETLDVTDTPPPWDPENPHRNARWRTTVDLLAERRQTLPTSDELLWAASAGGRHLFPWGDDPSPIHDLLEGDAAAIAEMYGADPNPHRPHPADYDPFEVFAGTNAFGLVAPLGDATWCMPDPSPDTATPLVRVGGPLGWYPWQGGWEAMLFLTRVVSRVALDGRIGAWHAAIRPIVRLAR